MFFVMSGFLLSASFERNGSLGSILQKQVVENLSGIMGVSY